MTKNNQEITRLNWDSDFFGIEVGSFLTKENKLHLADHAFNLVYIHAEKKITNASIPCYDKKITFRKTLSSNSEIHVNSAVKEYHGIVTPELLDLAIASGIYSRFKLDPKLSPKFEELYTLWIKNSLKGILADFVFTYETDGKIIGFVSLKKKNGFYQVGLIATSHKHREMGIGTALLQKIEAIAIKNNSKEIRIVSQLDNQTAYHFYLKNNYEVDSLEYVYHLWS